MELRQLRYFVAIFEHRSISRAAEHLRISQPALTRQLRQLERFVHAPLFDRVPAGVSPTPAALALHEHARLVLRLADATREVVRSAGPAKEIVRVGLPPGAPVAWLEQVLRTLRDRVPEAAVSFTDASSADQVRMLREGHLDLALTHQRPAPPFTARLLYEQPFGVAIRPDHPLAGRTRCPLADLDGVRVLAHSRDQVTAEHDRVLSAAEALEVRPDWVFAWFTENALACVTASDAVAALLTRPSAERLLPGWPWAPLSDPGFALPTWLARQPQVRAIVATVADVFATKSPTDPAT
ncbi:LysR family transcriptional regulator [Amycolatopsis sp. NBC_01480]|uniref:LysR family transcriptional regulator n=1 Tax=Amycolatopsis sp. NBC_01480 TaxID=2903562 RepID=UPI002E2C7DF0|nr:LysR family transcriptional regulator [Amycolatopsis sp. NBC_01480]